MEKTTEEIMAEESFNLNKIVDEFHDEHGDPVAKNENMLVFADTDGYELDEIAAHTAGVDRGDVAQWMHRMARKVHDRGPHGGDAWSVADPVVVLKWNDGDNPHLPDDL